MDNKKVIKLLKKLTANHNDRIACYESGITETSEPELKTLLTHFVQVSKKIKEELSNEIRKSGGLPPDSARAESKFVLAWENVKKAIDKDEPDEILQAIEQCEEVIVDVYDSVLADHEDEFVSEEQMMLIQAQHKLLSSNLKEVIDSRGLLTHPK